MFEVFAMTLLKLRRAHAARPRISTVLFLPLRLFNWTDCRCPSENIIQFKVEGRKRFESLTPLRFKFPLPIGPTGGLIFDV